MPKKPPSLTPRREQILDLFYAAIRDTGEATSADAIARQLGISPAGVHKTVTRLIRDGYLLRTRRKYRRFQLGPRALEHYGITRELLTGRQGSGPQLRLGLRTARPKPAPAPVEQMELSFVEAV